ncbi:MAG: hypothetical protein WED82_01980 [Balneolales bacterium]
MSSENAKVKSEKSPFEGGAASAAGDERTCVQSILTAVNSYMTQADMYEELFDSWDPETSDPVEYENYYNRVNRIWQELEDGRALGEGNDEILDAWERVHEKACEVYTVISKQKFSRHYEGKA